MEQNIISKAFKMARNAGLVNTQQDFAKLVGANPSTISRAIANDSEYLTDKLIFRVEKILSDHGVVINGDSNEVTQTNNAPTDPNEALIAEMAAAREMYDRHLSEVLQQNAKLISIIAERHG